MKRFGVASVCFALLMLSASPAFAGGGGGGGCVEQSQTARGTRVLMRQYCFMPGILVVAPGTTVTFSSEDEAMHTVTSTDGSNALSFKFVQGLFDVVRFTKAGIYRYRCEVHPNMVGQIRVGSSTARGPREGVVFVRAGATDIAASPAPAETNAPAVTTAPAIARTGAASKASVGLLGIPIAALIWLGVRRRRRRVPA
jgi:plastocyanin